MSIYISLCSCQGEYICLMCYVLVYEERVSVCINACVRMCECVCTGYECMCERDWMYVYFKVCVCVMYVSVIYLYGFMSACVKET